MAAVIAAQTPESIIALMSPYKHEIETERDVSQNEVESLIGNDEVTKMTVDRVMKQ